MNDKPDPFDLKRLELPDEFRPSKRLIGKHEQRQLGQFTRFPNTWAWRLRGASGQVWSLARYLLWCHWLQQRRGAAEEPFTISNGACTCWGVSRHGKRRALAELEKLGLIRVTRRDYKNPLVVLRFPEPDQEEPCD